MDPLRVDWTCAIFPPSAGKYAEVHEPSGEPVCQTNVYFNEYFTKTRLCQVIYTDNRDTVFLQGALNLGEK